ncbi:MAG: endonuclease/exonuclease/phosphatase family protein [Bacteroidales bacterium]|nr:endonuclease/exonuclease/phosphatase family protein [Bacteroidales bacterium]
MVKSKYILPLALILLLAACQKQEEIKLEPWALSATLSGEASSAGFAWSAGDVVSANTKLSRSLEQGGAAASFLFDRYEPSRGERINVLYPGNTAQTVEIPTTLTCTAGKAPSTATPLWGTLTAADASVVMNPLYSLLRLPVTGTGTLSRVVVRAEGNEMLAGSFRMGYTDGAFNGSLLGGSSVELDLRYPEGITLSESGTVITVPVLSGRYTQGFSVKYFNAAGRYSTSHYEESGLTLTPGQVKELPAAAFRPDLAEESLGDYPENTLFDPGRLVAGTYNILAITSRNESCPDNSWAVASPTLVSIIKSMNCDILTLNEVELPEFNTLQPALRQYSWVMKKNSSSSSGYSFAPCILYKTIRFERLSDGIFWLSDPDAQALVTSRSEYSYTDPVDGTLYKAGDIRVCVWAKFRDKITGKTFYWFASHPTIRGTDAASSLANTTACLNAGNIRSLLAQARIVNSEGLPAIIAGDMNTWSGHVSYPLFGEAGWASAFSMAANEGVLDAECVMRPGTDVGYSPDNYHYAENRRIDHLFYRGGLSLHGYKTDFTQYNNDKLGPVYPSDHIPVRVEFSFE